MNTHTQTDIWIYRIVIVLSAITAISIASAIALSMGLPMPEILIAPGVIAVAGLARLLISPLN